MIVMMIAVTPSLKATIRATVPDLVEPLSAVLRDAIVANPFVSGALFYQTEYPMSAFGPKQTWSAATHMSAFRGKADMTGCGCPLSWSLLRVKRTSLVATHMSASDPKRTLPKPSAVGA